MNFGPYISSCFVSNQDDNNRARDNGYRFVLWNVSLSNFLLDMSLFTLITFFITYKGFE